MQTDYNSWMASFNSSALRSIVHHVTCKYAMRPELLGSTKLHKIIWWTELRSLRKFGECIANETFTKKPFGPCSDHLEGIVQNLVREHLLFVDKDKAEFDTHKYVGKGTPDTSSLSLEQLSLLDSVAEWIANDLSAGDATEKSHGPVWDAADMYGEMPIEAAAITWRTPTEKDKLEMLDLLKV